MRFLRPDISQARSEANLTDSEAAAAYVAELSADLAAIARRHGLDALAYILDMAEEEACHNAGLASRPRRNQ